jgi:N-acetylmuramoyl-L-alanine amidase
MRALVMRLFLLTLLLSRILLFGASASEELTVIIDPGHGGTHVTGTHLLKSNSSPNNATSPSGLREKDLTLELSREIQSALESEPGTKGAPAIKCILTRTNDWNPDFSERAKVAAEATNPAALVSIHFNTFAHGTALGTVAMIHCKERNPNHEADLRFADGLAATTSGAVRSFLPRSPVMDSINDYHIHDGTGAYLFYQMAKYPQLDAVPKCFLEVEFIDRRDVQKRLLDDRSETFPVIAKAIADYIAGYLREHPPRSVALSPANKDLDY